MTDDLVCAIREVVRDFVNESTLRQLERSMSGSTSSPTEAELSDWYANLPSSGKDHLRRIVSNAVDETIFGVLGVLDDMQGIEDVTESNTDDLEVCFVVDHEAETIV